MPKLDGLRQAALKNDITPESAVATMANATGAPQLPQRNGTLPREIDIYRVHPNPAQPRRILPSAVYSHWDKGVDEDSMRRLFAHWISLINEERAASGREEFEIYDHLPLDDEGKPGTRSDDLLTPVDNGWVPGFAEDALLEIISFAHSLVIDGKIEPAVVVSVKDYWVIESGERRWLAHHLLSMLFGDKAAKWHTISAYVAPKISVQRQAAENNIRKDLTGLARVRQYAAVLMDLVVQASDEDNPVAFKDREACANDAEFCRQACNLRVPYGQRARLMELVGARGTAELDRYQKILLLHAPLWPLADDYKIPIDVLLQLSEMTLPDAIQYIHKKYQLGTISDADEAPKPTPKEPTPGQVVNKIWKAFKKGDAIDRKAFNDLKAWIADVETNGKFKVEAED